MDMNEKKAYSKPEMHAIDMDANISMLAGTQGENTGEAPDYGGELGAPSQQFMHDDYEE